MWERTLMLRPRGNKPKSEGGGRKDPIARVCKRPYLINKNGNEHVAPMTVVTIQKKAWMDSAGVAMWTDLCLAGSRMLVIWDNCGPHKVDAVREVFREHNIATVELPPNMTDRLQIIDLVTNGPLKSGMRRKRVYDLYDYMQQWKHERLKALADRAEDESVQLPAFAPPKPDVSIALRNLFAVEMETLRKDSYKKSVRECFVKASQMKDPTTGEFRKYTDVKAGLLGMKIDGVASVDGDGTDLTTGSLADTFSELEVVPNPLQRSAAEWSEDSDEDDDGSDDDDGFALHLQDALDGL